MRVCANMYKQIGVCFKHMRAVTHPAAKFNLSRVIVRFSFLTMTVCLGLFCTSDTSCNNRHKLCYEGSYGRKANWGDPDVMLSFSVVVDLSSKNANNSLVPASLM